MAKGAKRDGGKRGSRGGKARAPGTTVAPTPQAPPPATRGTLADRDAYAWRYRVILTLVFVLALALGLLRGNLFALLAGLGGLGWLALVWRRRNPR
ncbi:MAG: hypothetical protein AAF577_02475 [Pseudomonadota bacterium]